MTMLISEPKSRFPARRRIRTTRPEPVFVEQIVRFSPFLPVDERTLLHSVYQRGMTLTAIARITGQSARILQARMRRILRRLNAPAFRYVVRHCGAWDETRAGIARAVICEGRTQREAAAMFQTSIHHIRREIDRILVLAEVQGG